MSSKDSPVRKALLEAYNEDLIKEAEKQRGYRRDSWERARELKKDVASTSSESARTWQTLNHLAGKAKGDAADASVRHRENIKESMAEDEETNAGIAGKRVHDIEVERERARATRTLLIDAPARKKK